MFKTTAWEQRRLGDIFMSLQNNTLSRADLSEKGKAMNIHYGDVLIKYGEVLNIQENNFPMIANESIVDKLKASFLQNKDIVVADTAEDETVGKCSEITGLSNEIVVSGLHTIPYRPLISFATGYLGYYMNSDSYHKQLIPLMQGIKVTSISKTSMQNTEIKYPESQNEQRKLGLFFIDLDNLITLHQCKSQ
ncbi:restriction endonuclease subunit S [Erysipelotrichaceae bacterium 66-17]